MNDVAPVTERDALDHLVNVEAQTFRLKSEELCHLHRCPLCFPPEPQANSSRRTQRPSTDGPSYTD